MMRIDFFHAIARTSVLLFAVLTAAGCGGGDDAAATSTTSTTDAGGAPSASTQAIESEMEQQMGSQPMGGAPSGGHDAGGAPGGGSGEMAMMNQEDYSEGESMEESYYGEEGMNGQSQYNGGGAQYSQQYGQANRGGRNSVPSRPVDVLQWTDTQILEAVAEKDGKVLQAIQAKAAASPGDPAFAQLMAQVLQKSSGGPAGGMSGGGAGGGFGIPGLGSFFGGGGSGAPPAAIPSMPQIAPGSAPPGGAFFRPEKHNVIPDPVLGFDSVEMMIGEAMMTYVPQAAQATRSAAQNLQGGPPSGHDAAGGNMSGGASSAPSGHGAPAGNMSGSGAASGHGAQGGSGYPPGVQPNAGYPNGQPQNGGYPGGMSEEDYYEGENMGYSNGGQRAGGPSQRPMGNLQDEELVRAVVRGLVINNSDPAWLTLKSIVSGTVLTPLPMPISTQIVLAEIFSAEKPNITVAADLLTAATKAVAANPAENQPTMRFLAALSQNPADHFLMLKKPTPPPPMAPAGAANGMAGANGMAAGGMSAAGVPTGGYNPNAVPGQPNSAMMNGGQPGAGYSGGMEPGGQMSEEEMYGEGYEDGSGGPGYGGGGPAGGRPPGPPPGNFPPVRVSESSMAAVASVLWNKNAVATVTSQLDAAVSPASVVDALALASTIPSDAVRHSTFTLFEKSHAQGAAGMTGSGLFRHVARDPGLLTVLKALPRKRARKPAASNINAPAAAPDPTESWVAATQDVMLSLRDRLRDVADNPDLSYDGLQRLRLHRGAVPERSIMIKAPNSGAEVLGEAAPADTTMFYTQCRLSPQTPAEMRDMQDIADHYEKRSKGIKREDRQRGILWYDGVKVNANGTRETIDVVIEQVGFKPQQNAGYGGGGGGYEDGGGGGYVGAPGGAPQFTIEVIVVVTKDPKTPPTAAAVSTASTK